ncbi:MAG: hypothetical protein AB1921_02985 [Thermodesulfobacteriota bacterium]
MDDESKKETAAAGEIPSPDEPPLLSGPGTPEPEDYYTKHRSLSGHTGLVLGKDFLTGCLTLTVGALFVFFAAVFAGILVVAYKVTVWLAVPVAALVAIVLLTTLVGRVVNLIRKTQEERKQRL